ncbi:MAG: hypothetical protein R2849_18695 [Thermomicrobiales bacterium]
MKLFALGEHPLIEELAASREHAVEEFTTVERASALQALDTVPAVDQIPVGVNLAGSNEPLELRAVQVDAVETDLQRLARDRHHPVSDRSREPSSQARERLAQISEGGGLRLVRPKQRRQILAAMRPSGFDDEIGQECTGGVRGKTDRLVVIGRLERSQQ